MTESSGNRQREDLTDLPYQEVIRNGLCKVCEACARDHIAQNLRFVIKKVGNIPRNEESLKPGLLLPNCGNYTFY